jgi:hypothetical protein
MWVGILVLSLWGFLVVANFWILELYEKDNRFLEKYQLELWEGD